MIEYENLGKLNQALVAQYREKFEGVLTSGWFILGQQVKQFEITLDYAQQQFNKTNVNKLKVA